MGFVVFNASTGIIHDVNQKFAEIVGRPKEELLEMDWEKMTHPDDIRRNFYNVRLLAAQKIKSFSMINRYLKPDGSIAWANVSVTTIGDDDSNHATHLCMVEDITTSKLREQDISYLNFHDVLTDLYNRSFSDEEKRRLDTRRQWPLSIIIADINGLKLINDRWGYEEGNRCLVAFAGILKKCCRDEDIIARVGGDEFCILLPQTDNDAVAAICDRIYKECARSDKNKETHQISVALGHATKDGPGKTVNAIEKEAEDFMYRRKLLERNSMHNSLITSIKATMFEKSHETEAHAERLVSLSRAVGESLDLSDVYLNELSLLATLHDIGKMSVGDHILFKPGKLTTDEWVEMKKHPEAGCRIAQASPELKPIANYIRCHHERWDGKGYPQGIRGEAIPLLSRILSVVDAYDAMTQDRPYRTALTKEEAIKEIRANAGTQFDPAIAKIFMERLI